MINAITVIRLYLFFVYVQYYNTYILVICIIIEVNCIAVINAIYHVSLSSCLIKKQRREYICIYIVFNHMLCNNNKLLPYFIVIVLQYVNRSVCISSKGLQRAYCSKHDTHRLRGSIILSLQFVLIDSIFFPLCTTSPHW